MIGAIADDFTGGTDVAVAFRQAGLRTAILFGSPDSDTAIPQADAVVIALKTRTIAPAEAVAQSLSAARWLRDRGVDQLFFKYCSTFDSTAEGNIGPVADALVELTGARGVVSTPSSPGHGRTVYMGHLFVQNALLSESPMRNHPLTPMRDSSVPRLLAAQTDGGIETIDLHAVDAGPDALRSAVAAGRLLGARYLVVDAVDDEDLTTIGEVALDDPLLTGAAGLAGGWARAIAARRGVLDAGGSDGDPVGDVRSAALAGSCSARTLEQIEVIRESQPSYRLDAVAVPDSGRLAEQALAWYDEQTPETSPLIYSSLPPAELRRVQEALGTERASDILETAMGLVARGLVARGVRRVVVAGGETSGAVVSALGVPGGLIGAEEAPGVPWIYTASPEPVALLLKSGNFGGRDLLRRAVNTGKEALA